MAGDKSLTTNNTFMKQMTSFCSKPLPIKICKLSHKFSFIYSVIMISNSINSKVTNKKTIIPQTCLLVYKFLLYKIWNSVNNWSCSTQARGDINKQFFTARNVKAIRWMVKPEFFFSLHSKYWNEGWFIYDTRMTTCCLHSLYLM